MRNKSWHETIFKKKKDSPKAQSKVRIHFNMRRSGFNGWSLLCVLAKIRAEKFKQQEQIDWSKQNSCLRCSQQSICDILTLLPSNHIFNHLIRPFFPVVEKFLIASIHPHFIGCSKSSSTAPHNHPDQSLNVQPPLDRYKAHNRCRQDLSCRQRSGCVCIRFRRAFWLRPRDVADSSACPSR